MKFLAQGRKSNKNQQLSLAILTMSTMKTSQFGFGQPPAVVQMDDILNMLRDDSFPKYPPFLGIQTRLNSKPDKSENFQNINEEAPETLMSHISPSKKSNSSKKKKGVVFRQNLEEYCVTSPQKIEPEDMKTILAKTAKKGILVKRVSSSCQYLPEPGKLKVPHIQSLLKIGSNTSIDLDLDEGRKERAKNSRLLTKNSRDDNLSQNNNSGGGIKLPLAFPDHDADSFDGSILSSQEREHLKDSAGSTPKAFSSKEVSKTEPDTFDTPRSGTEHKRLSFSEILPTVAVPNLRRNESSIAGSLNDIPVSFTTAALNLTPRKLFNYPTIKPKAESQNDLDRKAKPSPRIRTLKQSESSSVSFNPQRDSEENNPFKGGDYQPLASVRFVPFDYAAKPIINGYNNPLTASLNGGQPKVMMTSQSLKKFSAPIKPQSQESSRMPDIKKVQTAGNNQLLIKTNSVSTPSRNKTRTVSLSSLTKDCSAESITNSGLLTNQKGLFNVNVTTLPSGAKETRTKNSQETICIRRGNQVIFYSIKDNSFKVMDIDQNFGLEGCSFTQLGAEGYVLSGGVDSQASLVSSKVALFNASTGEKDPSAGMPIARYNHATISMNKSLYILAGQSFEQKTLKSCYVFDLEKKNWLRIPSMRYERINPHAFVSSKTGNLYVFGGVDSEGNEIPWVEKFDPQRCIWQLVYNTSKFNSRSKDMTVLGNSTTGKSEEILLLVKENDSHKNRYRYSLLAFDTEKEILQAKPDFLFQTTNPKVIGFLAQGKVYIGEKEECNIMDVYSVENRSWAQKKFEPVNFTSN